MRVCSVVFPRACCDVWCKGWSCCLFRRRVLSLRCRTLRAGLTRTLLMLRRDLFLFAQCAVSDEQNHVSAEQPCVPNFILRMYFVTQLSKFGTTYCSYIFAWVLWPSPALVICSYKLLVHGCASSAGLVRALCWEALCGRRVVSVRHTFRLLCGSTPGGSLFRARRVGPHLDRKT